MENQTSFDLNNAIQRWRENLAQSPAFRSENLNELESHLRDSIVTLQTRGLTEDEAFLIAVKRVGSDDALEAEFGKVNKQSMWLERLLWMLIGVQVWGLVYRLIPAVARTLFLMGWKRVHYDWHHSGLTLPVILFVLVQLLSLGGSVWFSWWLVARGGKFGSWVSGKLQRRSSFVACCFMVGLASLCLYLSVLLPEILQFRVFGRAEELGALMGYAQGIVLPIQIVGMVILTLFVARRRLAAARA